MDIETMKSYLKRGLWTIERLNKLLEAKKITAKQYEAITGTAAPTENGENI